MKGEIKRYRILKRKKGIFDGKEGWFLVKERIDVEPDPLNNTPLEVEVYFTLEETILLQVAKLEFYLTEKQMEEYKKRKLLFLKKMVKEYL